MFLKRNRFSAFTLLILHFSVSCQAFSVAKASTKGCGNDCETRDKDVENTKFIDLTHAFNNNTARWPGRKITFFTEWSASYGWCTSEHSSTHMDAPYHFNEFGRRLNEIPFEDLIDVPGVMIDIYDKVHEFSNGSMTVNDNYALTVDDILAWEEKNGLIPQKAVVLLRTGWGSRWSDPILFRGEKLNNTNTGNATNPNPNRKPSTLSLMGPGLNVTPNGNRNRDDNSSEEDNANEINRKAGLKPQNKNSQFYDPSESWLSKKLSFPGYGALAAKFLAEERSVRGAGVDTISIDPGNQNVLSPAHVEFTSRNIYLLEMVANLHVYPLEVSNCGWFLLKLIEELQLQRWLLLRFVKNNVVDAIICMPSELNS